MLKNYDDILSMQVYAFVGKGRGVVATRKFEKGEFVVEYAGELINAEIAHEREVTYAQDENTGCYMYYFNYKENKYWYVFSQYSCQFPLFFFMIRFLYAYDTI